MSEEWEGMVLYVPLRTPSIKEIDRPYTLLAFVAGETEMFGTGREKNERKQGICSMH